MVMRCMMLLFTIAVIGGCSAAPAADDTIDWPERFSGPFPVANVLVPTEPILPHERGNFDDFQRPVRHGILPTNPDDPIALPGPWDINSFRGSPRLRHKTVSKTNAQGIELKIRVPQTIISGTGMYVTISVKNTGTKRANYSWNSYTDEVANIHFEVTRDGTRVPWTGHGTSVYSPDFMRRYQKFLVQDLSPKEELKRTINLARYFDFSVAGDYKISSAWWYYDFSASKKQWKDLTPKELKEVFPSVKTPPVIVKVAAPVEIHVPLAPFNTP